jgi:hypothetical protein
MPLMAPCREGFSVLGRVESPLLTLPQDGGGLCPATLGSNAANQTRGMTGFRRYNSLTP